MSSSLINSLAPNWSEAELTALCPDWPTAFISHYQSSGLWQNDTLSDLLERNAHLRPDAIALIDDSSQWTYAQLLNDVEQCARGLVQLGLKRYERVILQLPNRGEFIISLFALFRIGALPIMALPAHRYHEIHHFCDITRATAIITVKYFEGFDFEALAHAVAASIKSIKHIIICDPVEGEATSSTCFHDLYTLPTCTVELPPQSVARDLALFQLSGGTTGLSKLIPRRHDSYLCSVRGSNRICRVSSQTRYLVVLPASHNFVLSSPGILGILHAGGTVVLSTSPLPEHCFRLIAQHRINMTALVPPLALTWLRSAQRLALTRPKGGPSTPQSNTLNSLKLVQIGGARLACATAQRITNELGCQLQQVFGMAEGLVNFTRLDDSLEQIHATQGHPIYTHHDEIRIVDEHDTPVADGEIGELLTRGPYTIRGYFHHPEANRQSFTRDGFYRSGDLVRMNEEGNLVVEGRKKEQINRGGEKISIDEIENILVAHPDVHDAVVVGIADEVLGERAEAFVIPANTDQVALSSAEKAHYMQILIMYLRHHVAAFKIPDRFHFVSEFPQSGVGKNSRRALREQLQTTLQPPGLQTEKPALQIASQPSDSRTTSSGGKTDECAMNDSNG